MVQLGSLSMEVGLGSRSRPAQHSQTISLSAAPHVPRWRWEPDRPVVAWRSRWQRWIGAAHKSRTFARDLLAARGTTVGDGMPANGVHDARTRRIGQTAETLALSPLALTVALSHMEKRQWACCFFSFSLSLLQLLHASPFLAILAREGKNQWRSCAQGHGISDSKCFT